MRTVETRMPSTLINGNQGATKGYLRLSDGNRPEDLSLFHSLTCRSNVILDCYGVW